MFAKGVPIIKVSAAGGDMEAATARTAREKRKPGRKRSAAMEDEQLIKKIKLGKDVERNE